MPGNVWILLTQQGYTHPGPHRFFSPAPLVPLLLSDQKWKDWIEVEETVEHLRGQSGSINAELKWFMNSILTCGQRLQVKMSAFNWSRPKSNSVKSLMKPLVSTGNLIKSGPRPNCIFKYVFIWLVYFCLLEAAWHRNVNGFPSCLVSYVWLIFSAGSLYF